MTQYIMVYVSIIFLNQLKPESVFLEYSHAYFLVHISHTSLIRYNKLALLYLYLIVLIKLTTNNWKLANLNDYMYLSRLKFNWVTMINIPNI